jgi:diguanylate cyclase (GGDEF)-like protein
MDQFDDWLEEHRSDNDPWPKFDEFLRSAMYQSCRAKHTKPYRLAGDELLPLREPDPFTEVKPVSTRRGVLGYVVTTGRSYYSGDATHGELVSRLAEDSLGDSRGLDDSGSPDEGCGPSESVVWCFAIREGTRRLGVVAVRHLGIPPEQNKPLLSAVERLVNRLWCAVSEVCHSRAAAEDDPVSGLLTRAAFLREAEQSLADSYRQCEPAALVVIALENLRELNDSGRWETADELLREVSATLHRKVRMDDRLGRFDGSRLLLLLRRVDSELAILIVAQVMSRLTALCTDLERWKASVGVRCGVVGTGTEQPDLRSLISRALAEARRARVEGIPIASDLVESGDVVIQNVE